MRRKITLFSVAIIIGLALSGCGAIRSHRNVQQPLGSVLTTGIGGTLFRLNKTGDLPNCFGGRDIWGGKVDKGFAEIKLIGIAGAVLTLDVLDINKQSSETTMDRYKPFQNRNAAVNVDVDNTITISNQEQLRPYVVNFDTAKQKEIVIAGIRVTFKEVLPYSVQYTIEDVQP
jgi:hypothetical protein